MTEIEPGGRDKHSPAGHEDRRLASEKDLAVVLKEAAALAAELAVQIGEPVPSALTKLVPGVGGSEQAAGLEDAADLDDQLANLQVLVDDAAAEVETPPETLETRPEEPDATASPKVVDPSAPQPTDQEKQSTVASDPSTEAKLDEPTGVVGNMPRPVSLRPTVPVQQAAAEDETKAPPGVSPGQRLHTTVMGIALTAGDACTRFLELIDEPFQFVGWRLRVVIGWVALATVGTSVIVAILAMLL